MTFQMPPDPPPNKWSGHGLAGSNENIRTWESSRLRRMLRHGSLKKEEKTLVYGILANRRRTE